MSPQIGGLAFSKIREKTQEETNSPLRRTIKRGGTAFRPHSKRGGKAHYMLLEGPTVSQGKKGATGLDMGEKKEERQGKKKRSGFRGNAGKKDSKKEEKTRKKLNMAGEKSRGINTNGKPYHKKQGGNAQ